MQCCFLLKDCFTVNLSCNLFRSHPIEAEQFAISSLRRVVHDLSTCSSPTTHLAKIACLRFCEMIAQLMIPQVGGDPN